MPVNVGEQITEPPTKGALPGIVCGLPLGQAFSSSECALPLRSLALPNIRE